MKTSDEEPEEVETVTTAVAPRRGRPPMAWLTWADLMRLRPGTPILVDTGGHEVRTLGRIASRRQGRVAVVQRNGELRTFQPGDIERARVVDGLYEPGDPVLLRDVPAKSWRGGVVAVDGRRVYVETVGGFQWLQEEQLEHADDRTEAERAARPTYKPGPVAADAISELANQTAWEER